MTRPPTNTELIAEIAAWFGDSIDLDSEGIIQW